MTLEGVLEWGLDDVENAVDTAPFRDEYLAPFAAAYPASTWRPPSSRRCDSAGCAGRSTVTSSSGAEHTMTRLRMFLDRTPSES